MRQSRACKKPLIIDLSNRFITRGQEIFHLTPQEFALLQLLAQHPDKVLSREMLLAEAWGYGAGVQTRTLDNHIMQLRHKLGLQKEIETVYKCGYRLNLRRGTILVLQNNAA